MKQGKKLLLILLAVIFVIGVFPVSAQAENRQYVVRVSAGNKGTIPGYDNAPYSVTLPYGSTLPIPDAVPADGYYVKGIKESGKDTFMTGYRVTQDQDFIVVYGVKGREVRYVIRYLEYGTNTVLAEEQTFYADPGDKPVSSYIYIEGYQPYLRTTKTLVEDESQNVLFAYYTAIPAPAAAAAGGGGGGGGAAAGGNANAGANANAGNGNAGANANNPAVNPTGAGAGANNNTPAGNAPTPAAPAAPQYQQTEDILDLDVPLAAPDFAAAGQAAVPNPPKVIEPTEQWRIPTWGLIGGGAVLAGLIAMLYWYLLFYRKKKRYEGEYDFSAFDDGK